MFVAVKVGLCVLALCLSLPTYGESAYLTIQVTDEDGRILLDQARYVALIAQGTSLAEPTFEFLAEAGQELPPITVEPGRYWVLCGAAGFALDLQPGWLEIHAGRSQRTLCRLKELVTVQGRTVHEVSGQPIRGARIIDEAALLLAHSSMLSAKALEVSLESRSATSDETGAFKLSGVPDSRTSLLVTAPDLAPYRATGVVISARRDLGRFALSPGGRLDVRFDEPESSTSTELTIVLRKPSLDLANVENSALDDVVLSIMAQRREEKSGRIRFSWNSLPLGPLEVWAESKQRATVRYEPELLAVVEIGAGKLSELSIPGPALVPALTAEEVQLRITVSPRSGGPSLRLGELILTPESNAGEVIRHALRLGWPVLFSVPAESHWSVRVELPGYWAPIVNIDAGAPGVVQVQQITVAPSGTVVASVSLAEKGEPLPESLTVHFESAAGELKKGRLPPGSSSCPIVAEKISCSLPVGNLDLTLSTAGMIPVYRWNVAVVAEQVLDLGQLKLARGASVRGLVEVEEGALNSSTCVVSLLPPEAGRSMVPSGSRVARTGIRTSVSERGFFQFTGVKPGKYLLRVEQPGFAAAELFPVDVWRESETRLQEPLILRRPVQIRVRLEPAVDWLHQPWRVEILRQLDFGAGYDSKPVFDGEVLEDGWAIVEEQRPGRFRLSVMDSVGGRWFSDSDWVVSSSSGERTVTLGMVDVSGLLQYGKERVAGELWFGGRFGAERVHFSSAGDGIFEGPLPRDGDWRVQIEVPELELETWVRVQVVANRSKRARLEIKLPATEIFGQVIDSQGATVGGARVSLSSEAGVIESQSEEDGTFLVRAAPPGNLEVSASDSSPTGPRSSASVFFQLQPDQSLGPMTLTLVAKRRVRGRVVSRHGPLPGARVRVTPIPQSSSEAEVAVTDIDGVFEIQVPEASYAVAVTLATPGYGFKLSELPIGSEGILPTLEVESTSGNLRLHPPAPFRELLEKDWAIVILQNGRPMPLSELARWATGQGVSFWDVDDPQLPGLAPGAYEACLGPSVIAPADDLHRWKARSASCKSGFLTPGGNLDLKVDELPSVD